MSHPESRDSNAMRPDRAGVRARKEHPFLEMSKNSRQEPHQQVSPSVADIATPAPDSHEEDFISDENEG